MLFLINAAMVNIDFATAGLASVLGYAVVFIGLILLMAVVALVGRALSPREKEEPTAAAAPAAAPVVAAPVAAPVAVAAAANAPARGTAGELKLHDVSPKDAALIMAVVAYKSGKPLNQLRFKSIKEVKGE